MSDISIQFGPVGWLIAALYFGWPGLIVGAAIGAFAWKRRRVWGGVVGALAGCLICFLARVLTL